MRKAYGGAMIALALLVGCTGPGGEGLGPQVVGVRGGKADQSVLDQIVAPDQRVQDRGYAEWSGLWWVWAFSLPATNHPLLDNTGANCAAGQKGAVWYLGGHLNPQTVTRACTVPKDTYLFVNIVGSECSPLEGTGPTYQQLYDCAKTGDDMSLKVTKIEIDGQVVPGLEQPTKSIYRVISPVFAFTLPADNIEGAVFGVMPPPPEGTVSTSLADGVNVMLKPLSPGTHTIHFRHETDPPHTNDITYNLTVE